MKSKKQIYKLKPMVSNVLGVLVGFTLCNILTRRYNIPITIPIALVLIKVGVAKYTY